LHIIDENTAAGKIEKKNHDKDSNNYTYEEMLMSIQTMTDK